MPRRTHGKVALVTGSSSGIGLAAAGMFKEAGFTVYASARRPESLEDLRRQGFSAVQLDVTDEDSVQKAVAHIEKEHGAVDVLVNNAGYGQSGPVEVLPLYDIRRQFETNVFGPVRLSQLVLPGMRRKGWGRVINVGSIGGTFATLGAGAYHASKFAIEAFSDALRAEVEGFGVDVALIQPTGVYTKFDKAMSTTYPHVSPDSPYHFFTENHKRASAAVFQGRNTAGVVSAEQVARKILHAATAPRPRTRYRVGLSAHVLFRVRRTLSDRAWDRMTRAQFPVVPKGRGRVPSKEAAQGND